MCSVSEVQVPCDDSASTTVSTLLPKFIANPFAAFNIYQWKHFVSASDRHEMLFITIIKINRPLQN